MMRIDTPERTLSIGVKGKEVISFTWGAFNSKKECLVSVEAWMKSLNRFWKAAKKDMKNGL